MPPPGPETPREPDVEERVRSLLAEGDVDGATTLVCRAHGPWVAGYLLAVLPPDDAQDAKQTWAEDVWNGLVGFRWECKLRTWLYRLALNAVARLKREGYRRRRASMPDSLPSRLAASITSDSGFLPGSRRARLAALREHLSLEEKTLLTLRTDRDMEWSEITEVLSATGERVESATLRKRYERLTRKLKEMALQHGLLDDDDRHRGDDEDRDPGDGGEHDRGGDDA